MSSDSKSSSAQVASCDHDDSNSNSVSNFAASGNSHDNNRGNYSDDESYDDLAAASVAAPSKGGRRQGVGVVRGFVKTADVTVAQMHFESMHKDVTKKLYRPSQGVVQDISASNIITDSSKSRVEGEVEASNGTTSTPFATTTAAVTPATATTTSTTTTTTTTKPDVSSSPEAAKMMGYRKFFDDNIINLEPLSIVRVEDKISAPLLSNHEKRGSSESESKVEGRCGGADSKSESKGEEKDNSDVKLSSTSRSSDSKT